MPIIFNAAQDAAELLLDTLKPRIDWPDDWKRTPERFSKAWDFFTSGYNMKVGDIITAFEENDCGDGMIFQGSIPFFSLCCHHLVPFFGVVHFAYIPEYVNNKTRIVGLSKIARLVEVFARRLQVQEKLTMQINDAFFTHMHPQGSGCVVRGRHLCQESRGVQKLGTSFVTSNLKGLFMTDPEVRSEFFSFVRAADAEQRGL